MKKLLSYLCLTISLGLGAQLAQAGVVEDVAKLPTDFNQCREVFANSKPVRRADVGEVELCYNNMAILYQTKWKHAVYAVTFLDAIPLIASEERNKNRKHLEFFADPRVHDDAQAQNRDFASSGYDRGHLIANGHSTSIEMQEQSFVLTNVCAQDPHTNREGAWRVLESSVRKYIKRTGDSVHLYAGCYADPKEQTLIGDAVVVASHFWMLVVPKSDKQPWGFIVRNAPDSRIGARLSKQELEEAIKFSVAE